MRISGSCNKNMDLVMREGVYVPSLMEGIAILLNPNIDR